MLICPINIRLGPDTCIPGLSGAGVWFACDVTASASLQEDRGSCSRTRREQCGRCLMAGESGQV